MACWQGWSVYRVIYNSHPVPVEKELDVPNKRTGNNQENKERLIKELVINMVGMSVTVQTVIHTNIWKQFCFSDEMGKRNRHRIKMSHWFLWCSDFESNLTHWCSGLTLTFYIIWFISLLGLFWPFSHGFLFVRFHFRFLFVWVKFCNSWATFKGAINLKIP